MEEKPIEVLVEEYKKADRRFTDLLKLGLARFPPSVLRRYGLPVLNEKDRQRAKAEYQRLGGDGEFKEVGRLREELRRAIAERRAQQPQLDAETERFLEDIAEYVIVKRKSASGVEDLGKIPRLGGKAARRLLQRWFGPGTYELEYVRGAIHEGPSLVKV